MPRPRPRDVSEIQTFQPIVQVLNACTSTQMTDVVADCYASGSMGDAAEPCGNWLGANPGCVDCIFSKTTKKPEDFTNQGAVLLWGGYFYGINTPGCIAQEDPKNGPACAAVLEPLLVCEDANCGIHCKTNKTYDDCLNEVVASGGACSSFYTAYQGAPCSGDLKGDSGVVSKCADTDYVGIVNLVCGTGT